MYDKLKLIVSAILTTQCRDRMPLKQLRRPKRARVVRAHALHVAWRWEDSGNVTLCDGYRFNQ